MTVLNSDTGTTDWKKYIDNITVVINPCFKAW